MWLGILTLWERKVRDEISDKRFLFKDQKREKKREEDINIRSITKTWELKVESDQWSNGGGRWRNLLESAEFDLLVGRFFDVHVCENDSISALFFIFLWYFSCLYTKLSAVMSVFLQPPLFYSCTDHHTDTIPSTSLRRFRFFTLYFLEHLFIKNFFFVKRIHFSAF